MAKRTLAENIEKAIENFDLIEQSLNERGIDTTGVTPNEYADKVLEVQTDLSDATATTDDIISPKTAYIKGGKVTGNIKLTTKSLAKDKIIETSNIIGLTSNYLAVTPDGYAICTNTMGNIVLINLNTGDNTVYTPSQFGITTATTSANGVKAITVCPTPNEYGAYMVSIYTRNGWSSSVTEYFSCSYYKDGKLLYVHDENQALYRTFTLTSDWGRGALVSSNTKPNTIACFASRKTNSIAVTMALDLKSHSTATYTKYDGDYSYKHSIVQVDKNDRIMFMTHQVEGTSSTAICGLNDNFTIKNFASTNTNYRPFFIETPEQLYAIHNNNLIKINWNESNRTFTTSTLNTSVFPENYRAGYSSNELIFITNNDNTGSLYKYTINDSTGIYLELLKTYDDLTNFVGAGYQAINYNNDILYTDNNLHLIRIQLKKSGLIEPDTIVKDNITLYNTDDAEVLPNEILQDRLVYANTGKIIGTMPNNGELNYIPTTEEQIIPKGYTTGGIIEPVTSNIDENIKPENIKKDIEILGIVGIIESSGEIDTILDVTNNDKITIEDNIMNIEEYTPIIPKTYKEIEYVQCTGSQYLDTDIPVFNYTNFEIELDILFTNVSYNYNAVLSTSSPDTNFECWIDNTSNLYFRFGGTKPAGVKVTANTRYNLKFRKTGTKIEILLNDSVKNTYTSSSSKNSNLRLFNRGSAGSSGATYGQYKLYNCKITCDGELMRDLIPVRDLSFSYGCLYDNLYEKFYINSVNLTKGADI